MPNDSMIKKCGIAVSFNYFMQYRLQERRDMLMEKRISEKECENLYKICNTPPHVIAHCRAVSRTAVEIGQKLNLHGFNLDLDLIRGAGLSHDVARTSENHGEEGAKILEKFGYRAEADIVRVHMYYDFNSFEKLNETDLVCLGDRLVIEGHYAGLDKRFEYIMHKAPQDEKIRSRLLQKKKETRELLDKIEKTMGETVDSLFSGHSTSDEEA